jgi:hypothetical protein
MSTAKEPAHIAAHRHSSNHRSEVLQSDTCGCFCCLEIYRPSDIIEWVDDKDGIGTTAICPRCGIDSVLGAGSGYPITRAFLEQMEAYWFS